MKKQLLILILGTFTFLLGSPKLKAQTCPASVTASATPTARTCNANGSISVTVSDFADVSLVLLNGGQVVQQVNPNSSPHNFTSLNPGNYQVRIICRDNQNIVYQTIDVTVNDNYVPITNANISVSDVCTSFAQGGNINISSVTGGVPAYQVSIIKNNDPAYSDALSSYQPMTLPFTKNVTEFGTYQVRIKDACGPYKTFTVTLSPSLNGVRFYWMPKAKCGSTTHAVAHNWYANDVITGGTVDISTYQQLQLVIRDTNATGAILYTGTYNGTPFEYQMSPTHSYYITSTNLCGISTSYTHTLDNPNNNPEFHTFTPIASTGGCGAAETETITIFFANQSFWNYPVTVTVKNSAGATVYTSSPFTGSTWSRSGLPVDTYEITVTDSCNPANSATKTVANPVNAGAPHLNLYQTQKWRCSTAIPALTQTGTTQALVEITGYLPNRSAATVTIIAGPSNVGVAGGYVDNQYWGWSNMLPGTYTYRINDGCGGAPITGTFIVPNEAWRLLHQSVTSTATSTCTGNGSITSNVIYDGSYIFMVELLNAAGTVLQSNTTGNFTNIPAGTYKTRLRVAPNCLAQPYYLDGSEVTITNAAGGISILPGSTGVICEDSNGNPLSTGTMYLNFAGVAPFKLSYRPASASTYTVVTGLQNSYAISGLTANTLYDFILEDACGASTQSQNSIGTMGVLTTETTSQPCYNQPYYIAMRNYSGATYEWTNPQGAVVSNTRSYSVATYTAAYDGLYTVKITWSNCVTRYVRVHISGQFCNNTIGCFRNPGTTKPVLDSKHGITALGRAGADNSNWPMVRKGAHTVLEANTKGFVINRLTTAQKNLLTPAEAMMVYDTDLDCLSIYTGGSWKCYSNPGCPD